MADLAQLVTYDEQLRRSLPEVWPPLLRAALDALEERGSHSPRDDYWWDLAVAALVPTPQINLIDRDPDATLDRAYETWISPDALAEQIPRWLEVARGEPKAADAVARLAPGAPEPWQATTGLEWVEELIGGQYDRFARRCWFVTDWLKDLRGTRHLAGTALARWRRVVDGMAAAGDDRAAELQRAEE